MTLQGGIPMERDHPAPGSLRVQRAILGFAMVAAVIALVLICLDRTAPPIPNPVRPANGPGPVANRAPDPPVEPTPQAPVNGAAHLPSSRPSWLPSYTLLPDGQVPIGYPDADGVWNFQNFGEEGFQSAPISIALEVAEQTGDTELKAGCRAGGGEKARAYRDRFPLHLIVNIGLHVRMEAPSDRPRWTDIDWKSALTFLAFSYTGKDALWRELPTDSYRFELGRMLLGDGQRVAKPDGRIGEPGRFFIEAWFHHDVSKYAKGTPIALEAYVDCSVLERLGYRLSPQSAKRARSGRLIPVIADVETEYDELQREMGRYVGSQKPWVDYAAGDRVLDEAQSRWPESTWALQEKASNALMRGELQLAAIYRRQGLAILEAHPPKTAKEWDYLIAWRTYTEYFNDIAAGRKPSPYAEQAKAPAEGDDDEEKGADPKRDPAKDRNDSSDDD